MGKGPLSDPVILEVKRGQLVGIEGRLAYRLTKMLARCNDPRMTNIAEVSMGLNPAGRVCSVPMETESAKGTAHIALGNSIAYGGTVDAVAHLDCVMMDAVLELDGRVFMEGGDFQ
jgi:2,5-dihydroxypyridine 5,6-dioxygenase